MGITSIINQEGEFTLVVFPSPPLGRSGQQILLGDRVVITGDKIGCVRYIGKLEFDPLQRVFIGVHLDSPGMPNQTLVSIESTGLVM